MADAAGRPTTRHRPALHQHDPDAVDRRDPEGELGPPGHADGAGAAGLRALAAVPALRPRRPDLAEPRPLRALGRPRLDAALRAAPPRRGQGGRPRLRGRGDARRSASTTSRASASSTRARPGHPEYRWTSGVETTTGPLGQGIATSVGMAIASKWQAAHFNRPELRALRLRRLRDRRRRLPDGGRLARGRLDRRPPAARQPLLDLRQQPHHDRRPHRPHLRGRRPDPLRGLRLERDHGSRTPTTSTQIDARVRELPRRVRAPDADHRRQPHRLRARRTSRTPPRPTASRSARTRCARPRRAYGWPEDAEFLVPDGRPRALRRGDRQARRRAQRASGRSCSRPTRKDEPELAAELDAMQRRELPDGWDAEIPSFDADEKGMATRKASNKVENAVAAQGPLAARRLGGPDRLHLGRARGRRGLRARRPRRAASSTSGSASTSRRRSPTGSRSRSCARSGPPTSPSPTTRARRSGSRR